MHPSGDQLAELGAMASEGKPIPVIDSTWPFNLIDEAKDALEKGHARGKTVVTMEAA